MSNVSFSTFKKSKRIWTFILVLCLVAAYCSGIRFDSGSVTISLSLLILLLSLPFIALLVLRNTFPVFYKDKISLCIYGYLATNVFSSLINYTGDGKSIKGFVLIASFVLLYNVVRYLTTFLFSHRLIYWLISLNNLSVFFGLASMFFFLIAGIETWGISSGHMAVSGIDGLNSDVASIQALAVEPNLFASITGTVFCLYVSVFFIDKKASVKSKIILYAILLSILFAYTRTVYVACVFSMILLLVLAKKINKKIIIIYIPLFFVAALVLYFILPANGGITQALAARLTSLIDFEDGSGLGRVEAYLVGINGFSESPFFGKGTFMADTQFYNPFKNEYEDMMGSPGWLTGAWVQSLHDTGIAGFIVLVLLFYYLIRQNYRLFQANVQDKTQKNIFLGFMCGNVVLAICSQLSSLLWIGFPYVFWGINLSFMYNEKRSKLYEVANNL